MARGSCPGSVPSQPRTPAPGCRPRRWLGRTHHRQSHHALVVGSAAPTQAARSPTAWRSRPVGCCARTVLCGSSCVAHRSSASPALAHTYTCHSAAFNVGPVARHRGSCHRHASEQRAQALAPVPISGGRVEQHVPTAHSAHRAIKRHLQQGRLGSGCPVAVLIALGVEASHAPVRHCDRGTRAAAALEVGPVRPQEATAVPQHRPALRRLRVSLPPPWSRQGSRCRSSCWAPSCPPAHQPRGTAATGGAYMAVGPSAPNLAPCALATDHTGGPRAARAAAVR
jgi:hypothetical protein